MRTVLFVIRIDKEDELQCLIKGCNFLLKNIPDEAFIYQRHGCPEYKFQLTDTEAVFPYLLVNIGSGVSLIKVGCFLTSVVKLSCDTKVPKCQ